MTLRLTLSRQLRALTTQTPLRRAYTMAPIVHTPPPHPPSSPFTTSEANAALKLWHSFADLDKPANWQEQDRWAMCVGHLLINSLLERTYVFANYAAEKNDLANYLGFAEVAFATLWMHHSVEETIIFPQWTKAAQTPLWEENVAQHHLFESALALAWVYTRHARSALSPTPPASSVPGLAADVITIADSAKAQFPELDFKKPFNPRALQKQMEAWLPIAMKHMVDEIATLSPERMEKVGLETVDKAHTESVKEMRKDSPFWALPSAFSTLPLGIIHQMIQIPLPVRKILLPFVFSAKHWGFWKYAAHPENLTFWGTVSRQ